MRIACLRETGKETRVAITPLTAKQYIQLGFTVLVEEHAGQASGLSNEAYEQVGVQLSKDKNKILKQTQILLCVEEPDPKGLDSLNRAALLIGPFDKDPQSAFMDWSQKERITVFSMNSIPRISRAQSMDSLSSQANLAGYKAVLEAVNHFHRAVPMMMTAAGMIQPAKVLILGAGVAGLQAIATAKRLGAVVYAFDVRHAAKEQVESLGAEFVAVSPEKDAETQDGYASETSEDYKKKQAELIDQYARLCDIVVSTALIPGHKAPTLLYKETIEHMKPGSVVVDLATSQGGNCALSVVDKIIKHGEVTLIGISNLARLVPATASDLYANNLVHLIHLLAKTAPEIQFNPEDEIIQQAVLCHQGQYLPFQAKETNHV